MATPRSALRPQPANFLLAPQSLRKQLFAFATGASTAPPSSNKRKVAFNDEIYIQEIVDIRDKRMHWNAAVDEVAVAARVPLPVSPAPLRMVRCCPLRHSTR